MIPTRLWHFNGRDQWIEHKIDIGYIASFWGSAANDVWAVGDGIAHFDGVTWSTVVAARGWQDYQVVWGRSATDVWTGGSKVLHFDGAAWTAVGGSPTDVTSIWGAAADDVWLAGGDNYGHDVASLYHYDGHGFTQSPKLTFPQGPLHLWGSASNDVWVVLDNTDWYRSWGAGDSMAHWDGARWTVPPDEPLGVVLHRIYGKAKDDVWAVGDRIALHYDGTRWGSVPLPTSNELLGIMAWGGGPVDLYGYSGTLLQYMP